MITLPRPTKRVRRERLCYLLWTFLGALCLVLAMLSTVGALIWLTVSVAAAAGLGFAGLVFCDLAGRCDRSRAYFLHMILHEEHGWAPGSRANDREST